MNLGCLKSIKQTETIFVALGTSDIWPDCYSQSLPQVPKVCTDWAGPGPHPTLVLSMAQELIWHRAGKMCVEHWRNATSSFLPYKRQWYLLSCTEPSFPGIGFQKDRQWPPASSVGASGDRDSCSGQCWVATLSSIKDNRDHLGSEKEVWLSDSEQPWCRTLIQWIREG